MGLSELFKRKGSEKREADETKYIGDSETCEECGKKYYELKSSSIPSSLNGVYRTAKVWTCRKCRRIYCFPDCIKQLQMKGGCKCSPGQNLELVPDGMTFSKFNFIYVQKTE